LDALGGFDFHSTDYQVFFRRHFLALISQSLNVQLDRVPSIVHGLVDSFTLAEATRQARHLHPTSTFLSIVHDYRVLHVPLLFTASPKTVPWLPIEPVPSMEIL
jgi:hypothetical protein